MIEMRNVRCEMATGGIEGAEKVKGGRGEG